MRSHLSKTVVVAFAVLLGALCLQASELQEFKAVRYVPDANNDGDSFLVMIGDKEHRVRLYFVDCPETKTDPDRLAQLRKKQRQEDEELKEIQRIEVAGRRKPLGHDPKFSFGKSGHVPGFPESHLRIDINKATKRQVRRIYGIGRKRAQWIIDGRPYKRLDDVTKVKGIGPETLKKLRPHFYVPEG